MAKYRLIRRILASVLLTVALVADAYQVGAVASEGQVVQEANIFKKFKIKCLRKTYDNNGNFRGCVEVPCPSGDCISILFVFGEVTISSEDVNVR